jgi:hypothetical protein
LLTDIAAARGLSGSIQVTVSKEDDTRQDFGATLAIIFATPAAIAIAKGVHDFIAAKGHAVAIQHKNGSVIATGHAAKNIDIAETVHRLNLVR